MLELLWDATSESYVEEGGGINTCWNCLTLLPESYGGTFWEPHPRSCASNTTFPTSASAPEEHEFVCRIFIQVPVVVDDLMPCKSHPDWTEGKALQPLFARPNGNEIWVLLLEKAFAKLAGAYAHLDGGATARAFLHITGCKDIEFWKIKRNEKTKLEHVSTWLSTSWAERGRFYFDPIKEQFSTDMGRVFFRYSRAGVGSIIFFIFSCSATIQDLLPHHDQA